MITDRRHTPEPLRARYEQLARSSKQELIALMRAGITGPDQGVYRLNDACPIRHRSAEDLIEVILDVEFDRPEQPR